MRKLVIVNNGLKDQRGHYFETSLAIAEAARRAGRHPILAAHADCRMDLFPDWLDAYPFFSTDHWMVDPPVPIPGLLGVKADPYGPEGFVSTGSPEETLRSFFRDRFGPHGATGILPPPDRQQSKSALSRYARRTLWCADRAGYYLLPQAADEALRRWRPHLKTLLPRIARKEHRNRVRDRLLQLARRMIGRPTRPTSAAGQLGGQPAGTLDLGGLLQLKAALEHPVERQLVERALVHFAPTNELVQLEYGLVFKRDLERLLSITGISSDDHILLGTAHARELAAVRLFVERMGEGRSPTFHLEFRHPLFHDVPGEEELQTSPLVAQQRLFFRQLEEWGASPRIKLYTDTPELAREYAMLANLEIGVLPIPFRSHLLSPRQGAAIGPLVLTFLGDVRDEKGFHWLPRLVDRLLDGYLRTQKARFVLQASHDPASPYPRSLAALESLRGYPAAYVELVGLEGPLSAEAYYRLVSAADVVLLPYDRNRYRACSSGTLTEALAAGRPTVVPAQTWLSSQVPSGGGETFEDFESFVGAVKRVIDGHESYRNRAETHRAQWLRQHSPEAFVSALLDAPTDRHAVRAA